MELIKQLTTEELEAGLEYIRQSPKEAGELLLIVRRPQVDERQPVEEATLDLEQGLVGDSWMARGRGPVKAPMDTQLTIMNARAAQLVAQSKDRWKLAGDQLFVDLDLSEDNLPAGSRLAIGSAVVQVSPVPHTGCKKFVSRFGMEAMEFVNSPTGKQLHLRGINTRIIQAGTIRVGDMVRKLPD
jgi:MOSC domain-containing protein YiiM